MSLNVAELAKTMMNAAKPALQDCWKKAAPLVADQSKAFAQRLAFIEKEKLANNMSEEDAQAHIAFQKRVFQTALLTIEGLALIATEDAINAAINAVKAPVNAAIGYKIF